MTTRQYQKRLMAIAREMSKAHGIGFKQCLMLAEQQDLILLLARPDGQS